MSAPDVAEIERRERGGRAGLAWRMLGKTRRRLGLYDPFSVECPTPPRRDPEVLTGTLWGVTAYFNPSGSSVQRRNYERFRSALVRQGVPLLTVELAFGGRSFELGKADADHLIQVRGGDLLWQKERLLNVGIAALPQDCDRVAWLDADVLFDRDDWARETARLLEDFMVVQPFLRRVRLGPGQVPGGPARLPVGMGEGQVYYGVGYGVAAKGYSALGNYRRHGSTGLGWAARRWLLDRHGLYDRMIVGGSDLVMSRAMHVGAAAVNRSKVPAALARSLSKWCEAFHADVRGSVGYADCTVFHLWHGSMQGRRYRDRYEALLRHDYDPDRDVRVGAEGPLIWSTVGSGLAEWVSEYFEGRTAGAA
jgi:hypothetical protein